MASWGNSTNQQYGQDMDSNGYKLKVTHNANEISTELNNSNTSADARALC